VGRRRTEGWARREARREVLRAALLIAVGTAAVALAILPGTNPRFPMTAPVRAGLAAMGAGGIGAGVAYLRAGMFSRPFNAAIAIVYLGVAAVCADLYAREGSIGYAIVAVIAVLGVVVLAWRERKRGHKS